MQRQEVLSGVFRVHVCLPRRLWALANKEVGWARRGEGAQRTGQAGSHSPQVPPLNGSGGGMSAPQSGPARVGQKAQLGHLPLRTKVGCGEPLERREGSTCLSLVSPDVPAPPPCCLQVKTHLQAQTVAAIAVGHQHNHQVGPKGASVGGGAPAASL